ncbi:anti-sigma factor [Marinobacterium rhizophilum]|uniref:Zf-HC2 domain-containing protein n=1 Tax=Marinobacterium rhizophilum TaxID=420402 RepID=A0ABY5HI91_9GAMM|nr:zf-HC2 domain-containing protein [Marinobacterium rhizophilum]UTW11576.1 zf-HC2 domain-containing protein [Marinobacterium rhizophilum]
MTPSDNQGDRMNERLLELHSQLQTWLPGYVDGELEPQQALVFEAHLAGCDECRAEVARQQSLSLRLQQVATQRLSSEQHRRLDAVIDNAPPRPAPGRRRWLRLPSWPARLVQPFVFGATGWALALVLIAAMLLPGVMTSKQIPMMNDVLQEYQNLPQAALAPQNARPEVDLPARLAGCKLVASWKTRVGGEPAEAFALQRGEHLIIEYRITENVFYRNPDVRQAIADFGDYRIRAQALEVLALPLEGAGLLVVGPADALPHRREFIL